MLPQRLADALRDRAVGLAMEDHRIDRPADIIDRTVARDLDRASLRLDFDLAHRATVGIAPVRERLVAFSRERSAQAVVEIIEGLRRARDIEQSDRALRSSCPESAVRELDLVGIYVEHVSRDPAAAIDHGSGGAAHADARHAHRASRMRPAADRNDVGVALYQSDLLERHAEPLAHALGEARFMPLAARQRPDRDFDSALGPHADSRPFPRITHGELDVVREPDAAQPAAPPRLGVPLAEIGPVGERQRLVHCLAVIAVVVGNAEGGAIREFLRRDEIAPPDLDSVDAGLERGEIAESLHDEHRLRPARAAVGSRRHGVGQDRIGPVMSGRYPVDTGEDTRMNKRRCC